MQGHPDSMAPRGRAIDARGQQTLDLHVMVPPLWSTGLRSAAESMSPSQNLRTHLHDPAHIPDLSAPSCTSGGCECLTAQEVHETPRGAPAQEEATVPAYIIAHVDVKNWDAYREYMCHTPCLIAKFGGRFFMFVKRKGNRLMTETV